MQTFADSHALGIWLQAHQIDTTAWGQGAAKSIEDLWREVQNAESALYDEKPLRRVRVLELHILDGERQLMEAAQTLVSGQVRRRNQPPSEKMFPNEDPFVAARRCLAEEVGIPAEATVIFPPQAITERQSVVESASYPGLLTLFTFYRVTAQVPNLPTTDFTITNAAHDHGDPVIAHHWHWQVRPNE